MGRTARTPPKNRKPAPVSKKTTREVFSDDEVEVVPPAVRRGKSNSPKKARLGDEYDDIRKALRKSSNTKCYSSGSEALSSDDEEKLTPKKIASKKKHSVFVTPDSPNSDDETKKKKPKPFNLNNMKVHNLNFNSNMSNDSDASVALSVSNNFEDIAEDPPLRAAATLSTSRAGTLQSTSNTARNVATIPGQRSTGTGSTATAVAPANAIVQANLANFGIRPATNGNQQPTPRISELRAVIIRGVDGNSDILLRCEPVGINHSISWPEKIFSDAVRNKEAWVTNLNIGSELFTWFHENIQQNNSRGYPVRLFYIPAANAVTIPQLMSLCTYICERISSVPGNNTVLNVNANRFLWLDENAVWSDVVGVTKACQMVVNAKGNVFPGFYELHHEFIHTFFQPESFDLELVNYFHAPLAMLNTNGVGLIEDADNQED